MIPNRNRQLCRKGQREGVPERGPRQDGLLHFGPEDLRALAVWPERMRAEDKGRLLLMQRAKGGDAVAARILDAVWHCRVMGG